MAMVTSLISPQPQSSQHGTCHRYSPLPRPPPSPPMDEYKCSLPSISNLLGLADAGSPSSEACSRRSSPRPAGSALQSRPDSSSSSYSRASAQHPKVLPPTPPMVADASFEGGSSGHYLLSGGSKSSTARSSARYCERTPPLEQHDHHSLHPHHHQHHHHQQQQHKPQQQQQQQQHRPSFQQPTTPAATSAPQPSGYFGAPSSASLPPPPIHVSGAGLRYQRPLPQSFPPPPPPIQVTVAAPPGGFVWQHHHYLSPSHGTSFPPTQDRYICQTCNKAFSRPSSLRIHSHSHTGEKPFQCPHIGCGKAFSVRSNMKRHERGCHGFDISKGPILLT